MPVKFVLYQSDLGIFVGGIDGYAIFSKDNPLKSFIAFAFDSEDQAKDFSKKILKNPDDVEFLKVEQNIQYESTKNIVHVIDLIQSGHKEQSVEMFENLPCVNNTIH